MIRFELTQLLKIPGHKILVLDEIQNARAWAPLLKELYHAARA